MLVFSSDYPHVEGRHDALKILENHLPAGEELRRRFYGETPAGVLGLV